MSCSICTLTKEIPTCTNNLTIGTITPDTEAIIYFKNLATSRTGFVLATSDSDGLLIADLSELSFAANQAYEMHVVENDESTIETALQITIGIIAYDCLQIQFKRVYEGLGLKSYNSIILEIYE